MNFRQPTTRDAAALLLCLGLCSPSPAAAAEDDVAAMRRAIEELQAQNRALANRLATLEAGRSEPRQAARSASAPRAARAAQRTEQPAPPRGSPPEPAQPRGTADRPPVRTAGRGLEQRVRELEISRTAQEDAVRGIIQESFAKTGPRINEFVTLGGAIETSAGWSTDFARQSRDQISLDTAELDLEIRANDWMVGSLILSYASGTDVLFPTTTNFRTGVDRVLVDRATITIGDTARFPLFVKAGLDVLSFGTSTGFARLDTLAITSPLSTEVFETRRPSAGFGFEFPTPGLTRLTAPQVVPAVRPLVVNPLIGSLARGLGYEAPLTRPRPPTPFTFTQQPPPFYGSVYLYDSNSIEGVNRKITDNFNATLGYRTGGNCGRPYHELSATDFCPWSIDVSVDYISSIFDSRFLESQYRPFLRQIGYVPGMAASAKMSVGPVSLIAEWNGAIKPAKFFDDTGRNVRISPSAWQLSLGYQFDWNPWVESIGSQGTYVAVGYSGTRGLAGVTQQLPDGPARVGAVPKHRLTLTAAEWVLDGAKLAVEYSHNWDYSVGEGGTGNQADGVFTKLTYVW